LVINLYAVVLPAIYSGRAVIGAGLVFAFGYTYTIVLDEYMRLGIGYYCNQLKGIPAALVEVAHHSTPQFCNP
jgi:hypothetical protein